MSDMLEKLFKLKARSTDLKTESIAGTTTFLIIRFSFACSGAEGANLDALLDTDTAVARQVRTAPRRKLRTDYCARRPVEDEDPPGPGNEDGCASPARVGSECRSPTP